MRPLNKSKRKDFPKLAVYDIESVDWINVRTVCHLDEYGNRLAFKTVQEYLQWLLTDFEGDMVWSHFGSGYDNRFLVEQVHKWNGSSYKAIMSGGLPIIFILQNSAYVRPSAKNGKDRERQVTLLDSFRLLPTSLAKMGKSLGKPKMEVDRRRIEKLTYAQCVKYCMSDCEILLLGLQRFRETIVREGGAYSPTTASIASNFIRMDPDIDWKRFFEPNSGYKRYSGESFDMGYPESKPGMLQADEFCEGAYYGGRCEVGKHHADVPLYYYDIASAYPWAMRQKLPFYFQGFEPGAKWEDREELEKILKGYGVSDAYVSIPKGTFPFPLLPVRKDDKVVFAEGKFRGRWTNAELWELYKRGKDRGVRIDVTAWAKFTGVSFARPFVDKFYALRKQAKDTGDDAQSMIYKILLNACYGKLAQQLEQSSFVYGDAYEWLCEAASEDGRLKPCPTPGVSEIVEQTQGPFRHVAAGAYVTALARIRLYEGIETALKQGATLYYCDTDSIVIDRKIPQWGKSTELGSWELEAEFHSGAEFLVPKVYRARDMKTGRHVLKAKGTNLNSQLEITKPEAEHERERYLRWCVYARDISEQAKAEVDKLTKKQLTYYGQTQAGLLGWRSSLLKGNTDCSVATLDRMARTPDSKRVHLETHSEPLYLTGDDSNPYLDVRKLDAESLLEIELGEEIYAEVDKLRLIESEPEVYP